MIDVLIVEDHESSAEALARMLALWHYGVIRTTTLAGARKIIETIRPVHCFVDVMLPDGDGRVFMAEAKAKYPECRVFMWTASGKAIREFQHGDSPADDLLTKPPEHGLDGIHSMLAPPLSPPPTTGTPLS